MAKHWDGTLSQRGRRPQTPAGVCLKAGSLCQAPFPTLLNWRAGNTATPQTGAQMLKGGGWGLNSPPSSQTLGKVCLVQAASVRLLTCPSLLARVEQGWGVYLHPSLELAG